MSEELKLAAQILLDKYDEMRGEREPAAEFEILRCALASRPEAESEMPAGDYVLVPRVPTLEMKLAAVKKAPIIIREHYARDGKYTGKSVSLSNEMFGDAYREMIAAAPVAGNAARDDARDALDAQRYRWLREPRNTESASYVAVYGGKDLDSEIDAAIKASKQGGKA